MSRSDTGLCLAEVPLFYLESMFVIGCHLVDFLMNLKALTSHPYLTVHARRVWSAHTGLETYHLHFIAIFRYLSESFTVLLF
jgi:hypothetical protein